MQVKNYLLIIVLLFLGNATVSYAQAPCPLDAPTNLVNVINVPTYKTFTFTPTSGAVSYLVSMTNLSTNTTQSFYISGAATGFSANTETGDYLVELAPCCEGNIPSENTTSLTVNDTIIVVDLVGGYQSQCAPDRIKCYHSTLSAFQPYSCVAPAMAETYQFSFNYSFGLALATIRGTISNVTSPVQAANPHLQIQQVLGNPTTWVFENAKSPNNQAASTAVRIGEIYSANSLNLSAAFGDNGEILIKILTTSGGFSNFQLYTCSRNGGTPPGGDSRSDENYEYTPNEDAGGSFDSVEALNVFVSPNPFTDNLTLNMEAPETGNVSVQLYNLTGGLQKSLEITPAELTNNTYTIPTADLTTGMYIMQVSTEQGVRHTSKVFKL